MALIPDNIKKIDRDEFLTFLDVTPSENNPSWKVLGIGITDYGVDYNPSVDTEKWIIEKNARAIHSSNEKSGSVTQTIYKNDPCFEFVAKGRDVLNYKTHILDIDMWDGTEAEGTTTYPAKMSDGLIAITSFGGENAEIEFDLHYDGDPVVGTVTVTAEGVPTFTPTTSL